MLNEYIAYKIQEIQEKTYVKTVLILSSMSTISVITSGIALVTNPLLKYLAIVTLTIGIAMSYIILRQGENKIRKVLINFTREPLVQRYFAVLKDLYSPRNYFNKLISEPLIDDIVVRAERKNIEASTPLFRAKYRALKNRARIVIFATSFAITVPHIMVTKDFIFGIIVLIVLLLGKNKLS